MKLQQSKFQDTTIYISPLLHIEELTPLQHALIIEKIKGVKSSHRQCEIATTHLMVKSILGDDAKICHNENGAPYIENSTLYISISHSTSEVAIAINPHHPIGIDIENWREQLTKVKSKFLNSNEINTFQSSQKLLQAWTLKEALYKIALSPGISLVDDIRILSIEKNIAIVNTLDGEKKFTIHSHFLSDTCCLSIAHPLS